MHTNGPLPTTSTNSRLFSEPFTPARAGALADNVDEAERVYAETVDAFLEVLPGMDDSLLRPARSDGGPKAPAYATLALGP
ncbi:MAG: hypothetical protein FKY71_13255 [Spiribacter salinus]|uniref:Uncharacterized protein n=1 Tax=Spiribacter salinus TaxID=1335746 RepID=A0A540VP62_9GAMM|nr:MAG: hypothetical protein FKY71_13255 [Spiribacter salinus]